VGKVPAGTQRITRLDMSWTVRQLHSLLHSFAWRCPNPSPPQTPPVTTSWAALVHRPSVCSVCTGWAWSRGTHGAVHGGLRWVTNSLPPHPPPPQLCCEPGGRIPQAQRRVLLPLVRCMLYTLLCAAHLMACCVQVFCIGDAVSWYLSLVDVAVLVFVGAAGSAWTLRTTCKRGEVGASRTGCWRQLL
jgi:hypothetical protein